MTATILDYVRLRAKIAEKERAQARSSRLQRRQTATDALVSLRRGDIINITQGRHGGLAVVLEPARDDDDPRPLVLSERPVGGPDLVGGLRRCVAPGGDDVAAEAGRTPPAAGPPGPGVGAPVGRGRAGGVRTSKGKRGSGSDPDTDPELVLLREQLQPPPGARTARPGGQGPRRRTLSAGGTRQRPTAPEDRGGHQLAGAHVRPDRRVVVRTRLHHRSTPRT